MRTYEIWSHQGFIRVSEGSLEHRFIAENDKAAKSVLADYKHPGASLSASDFLNHLKRGTFYRLYLMNGFEKVRLVH